MPCARKSFSKSDPTCATPSFERPRFNSHVTSHRLKDNARFTFPMTTATSKIRKGRKSVFREVGLEDDRKRLHEDDDKIPKSEENEFREVTAPNSAPSAESVPTKRERNDSVGSTEGQSTGGKSRFSLSRLASGKRPKIKAAAASPPPSTGSLRRVSLIALLVAVVLPAINYNNGRKKVEGSGVDAGVIRTRSPILETRANSPKDVCKRWAAQSALLNGTLYYYGGRSITNPDQVDNQWNNDFITLDLTTSWSIDSPPLKGLPQPSGPPAISEGYLWNSFDSLFLYGGQFDYPSSLPTSVSTWQYEIASAKWTEFQSPTTSDGQYSDDAGVPVQRAAEGAGISVPELGLSWYFGGHLDWATTEGWSNWIRRIYLKSLLEFTHPGYANSQVRSLDNAGAPDGGTYRNITWAGEQNQDGFTERADGVIVYVPGWGADGIVLGLGGGVVGEDETTDAFASMSTIDVYDIASSQWYHQETSGDDIPQVRVNPCAVIFSAADASSFNIYMYGGQNLVPVDEQKQYSDMWILTIPSFTWIRVDATGDEPAARAGHSCAARDGQIIVVGGYIGNNTGCESPGIYAFDASNLKWQDSFNAGDHAADANWDNSVLGGSYGYQVPDPVQSVIGGSSDGGATATTPASGPATAGPFKTGKPPVWTVTAAGQTATVTNSSPGSTSTVGNGDSNSSSHDSARKGGLIAAGVIAGLAGLLALYLGFCAWLWRRQVAAYKKHMAVANRYSGDDEYGHGATGAGETAPTLAAAAAAVVGSEKLRKQHGRGSSAGNGDMDTEHFSWVGQLGEPRFVSSSDEPSPGSGTGSSMGRTRPSEDRNPWGWGYDSYVGGGDMSGEGVERSKSSATRSTRSGGSAEALLEGRQPHFFNVVLGPRRALRVVNGMEE
ncbi:hypothetical protein F5Y18DRAFT_330766 [Xylariaceae sp. FL1019]|nr:hypothetical protein F5Y18DRAFT_330766 [Xylariaceae sp. FL1019]